MSLVSKEQSFSSQLTRWIWLIKLTDIFWKNAFKNCYALKNKSLCVKFFIKSWTYILRFYLSLSIGRMILVWRICSLTRVKLKGALFYLLVLTAQNLRHSVVLEGLHSIAFFEENIALKRGSAQVDVFVFQPISYCFQCLSELTKESIFWISRYFLYI